jgi:di/tricarboxylate transporter
MKTIIKSLVLTILVLTFCACTFVVIALILNFWNETTVNALAAFSGSIIIGTITYFAIITAINSWKGDKLPF